MSSMSVMDKGYKSGCIVCGTPLMVGRSFCFDHLDMEGEWQFGQDREQDARAIKSVIPKQGLDYWVQKEYVITVRGAGQIIAWENENGEVDIYSSNKIQWNDVEEANKQPTGAMRMLTLDNKPFNEEEWRLNQINGCSRRPVKTNVRTLKQIYLTNFRH